MDEEDGTGMTGVSQVRVRKSKVNQVILVEKKHSSPDRYGSSGNLSKRNDASSFAFPEDMRISKLLNRLCAERSVDGALDLCGKLKGVIVDPTNTNYIRRSFDSILESCVTVFLDGPEECQSHIVDILAKIGVVMRSDFLQFRSGLLKSFKGNKNLRSAMMRVLQSTLELMRESEIDISGQIPKLLDSLKDFLEKTDNVEIFTSVSNVIETVAGQYPIQFRSYFTDIVDILVGWHLETEQTLQVKLHCGRILESFRPFWLRDIKFTERLLDQIVEDIVLHGEEPRQPVVFASFVGAFNTILKCIDVSSEASVAALGEEFLLQGFGKILSAAQTAIEDTPEEEVITTINESVALFFQCHGFDAYREEIQELIEIQLERIEGYSPDQSLSLIFIIVGFLRAMKTKISMDFIDLLLQQPHLLRERFSRDHRIREALVTLWQEIVDVKNVAILEKVYSQIISELESAMEVLKNPDGDNLMTTERGKFLIIFHLNSLARLATSSTSIIALYALKPSLLEMLTTNLAVTDEIWRQYPLVHHAIVGLLVAHCTNNGNFISSSGLLKAKVSHVINRMSPEDQTESPTSDNFELILSTMDNLLKTPKIPHILHLLLDWCHQLILQASAHGDALKDNTTFSGILQSVIEMPENEKSAEILTDLLDKFRAVDEKLFPGLAEVCCIEMCSTDSHIRDIYSSIFGKLPLNISLKQVNEFTGAARKWNTYIREMQQWHKNQAITNEIWPNHFRQFLEGVSFSSSTDFCENLLREMFKSAWTVKPGDYRTAALKDIRCLVAWIQWEAAQFCVANKLRTPFGKPQETFLKIEAIVKEDARILDLKESSRVEGLETIIANQRHARILLGFMEALEKAIYSATEGTAFALPGPEKPARSFFLLNSSTCTEWFNRIRTAVDLVALHCMEPEMVIRYSETTIKNLVETNRVAEPLFEHTLMSLAWALLRNGESDSLSGLYTWTKKITGRRLTWLKMAAEQAAGHRETAAAGYVEILEADPKLDKHIREFIADQLVQCLLWSMQWQELEEFLRAEETKAIPRVTIPLINITSKQVNCIIRWDEDESVAQECLSNWDVLTEETEFTNNFSYHNIISLAENTISCIFPGETTLSPSVLNTCSKIFQNGLQEALRTRSQEHLNNLTVINHVCQKVARGDDSADSLLVDKIFGSLTLTRVLYWAEFFHGYSSKVDDYNALLRLDLISMARKEGNLQLCKKELERYYLKSSSFTSSSPLESTCAAIMNQSETPVFTVNLGRAVYETSKWLYCFPEKREFALQFTAATALGIHSNSDPQISERSARILLTIAEWLLPEDEKLLRQNPLEQLLKHLPDDLTSNNVIPEVDLATGKLLGAAVKQCPDLAKAWNAYGGWCYKWGRKMVENRPSNTLFQPADIAGISKAIPEASQEDVRRVVAILSEHQVPMEIDDIEPGDGSSTELESHLRRIKSLEISAEQLQVIVGIWRRAHKHVYGYYEMAADAYFKYLQLGSVGEEGANSTVAATLRLLRLIVKHALGLQEVLEEGLASTPTSPWKVIIPQLFSRLNHHEPYVRRRVSELLCRVAEDSPHIIIFPAVVGAAKGEENTLSECFYSLLDTLSSQAEDTVAQVQLLVRELRRVCLLWDEMCLVAMSQAYVESSKKFTELDAQISIEGITDSNYGAFAEKYYQLMKPIVVTVEKLKRTITREAETKHEAAFQEKFSKAITELCELLKEPLKRESPLMPWLKFKSLCGVFQQRVQKRSNYVLKMSDISPVLAGFRDTVISMPGVESGKQHIYIRSVENMVQILNTKTKPKKLAFTGSDGNRYTYLFKGLEDLHLDERIMQFLSIANSMMTRTIDCNGNVSSYRARHYSVIPLGPQSGLISWVDGVLPLFSVYKKWQQRDAAKPRKDKEISPILRPSELFFSKLTPKLQEKGIKVTDSRSTWPVEVLRDVLVELAAETPKDLLSREFWCTSTTAAEWRQIIRNYSLSLAVMSVIGYIIGLGDRHLDNVLVNLSTGEIVHIDYNVCFEKGKTLRVPEKIPFRMTQNLENALGVTGIEGTFRLACENVLKALKRGRETLLTLLEAFVYDPLVDWAVGEDDDTPNGYVEAKQTSGAVQEREMLKLRYEEMSRSWKTNRLSSVDALKEVRENVKTLEMVCTLCREAREEEIMIDQHLCILDTTETTFRKQIENLLQIQKRQKNFIRYNAEIFRLISTNLGNMQVKPFTYSATVEIPVELNEFFQMLNEFGYIRKEMKEKKLEELFMEGYILTRKMNDSFCEQLRLVLALLEHISMYKDVQPFTMHAEIYQKRCEVYRQCRILLSQDRFDEAFKSLSHGSLELTFTISSFYGNLSSEVGRHSMFFCLRGTQIKSLLTKQITLENEEPQYLQLQHYYYLKRTHYARFLPRSIRVSGCLQINNNVPLENYSPLLGGFDNEIATALNVGKLISLVCDAANYTLNLGRGNLGAVEDILNNIWKCFKTFNNVFMSLLHKIVVDDSTVLTMITTVSALQHDDVSLKQMITDAVQELSNKEVSSSNALSKQVQEKFEQLVKDIRGEGARTTGQSLLLELYDAFPDMGKEFQRILESLTNATLPEEVEKVDVIVDARREMELFHCSNREPLQRLWSHRRLEVIIQFFTCTLQIACAFRDPQLADSKQVYSIWCQLFIPYEKYISTFGTQLLAPIIKYSRGLTVLGFLKTLWSDWRSHVSEESLKDILNAFSRHFSNMSNNEDYDFYEENYEQQMSCYMDGFVDYLSTKHWSRFFSEQYTVEKGKVKVLQFIIMAYVWRHGSNGYMENITQEFLKKEMKPLSDAVFALEESLQKMQEGMESILERVKEVGCMDFKHFAQGVSKRKQLLQELSDMANDAVEGYSRISQYESDINRQWKSVIDFRWSVSSLADHHKSTQSMINQLPKYMKALLDSLPADEQNITDEWIKEMKRHYCQLLNDATAQRNMHNRRAQEEWHFIGQHTDKLSTLHADFVRISTEIRGLLKSSLKVEGKHQNATKEYLTKNKHFSSLYGTLINSLRTKEDPSDILKQIDSLLEDIDGIFEGPSELKKYHHEAYVEKSESRAKEPGSLQKRNAYAVSVWRRIRMKLEGRDPDPTRRSTVPEQVDWMIKEAMDMDNLAVLYEGWTPWV